MKITRVILASRWLLPLAGAISCMGQSVCELNKVRARTEAYVVLDNVVRSGYRLNRQSIQLFESSDPVVQGRAISLLCGPLANERWIVYDPDYVEASKQRDGGSDDALYFLLAHEAAHHLNNDTKPGGEWSKSQELDADLAAAKALAGGLHFTKDRLQKALAALKPEVRAGYPSVEERQEQVARGYNESQGSTPITPSPPPSRSMKVSVAAYQASGVTVPVNMGAEEQASIRATGQWATNPPQLTGPGGILNHPAPYYDVRPGPGANEGCLVVRVVTPAGETRLAFTRDDEVLTVDGPVSAMTFLANDDPNPQPPGNGFRDNSGSLDVTITIIPRKSVAVDVSPDGLFRTAKAEFAARHYSGAADLFNQAALAGSADAMENLGFIYEEGLGVTRDYDRARQWYEKAAARGSSSAMQSLGALFRYEPGLPTNYPRARDWFEKAAAAGNVDAMTDIGYMFVLGTGVPQDFQQAGQWFLKAAAGGDALAMDYLAIMFSKGEGIPRDERQARRWWEKAAEAGDIDSWDRVGVSLEIDNDLQQARQWYEKGATAGSAEAMRHLGELYEQGRGVPRDHAKAQEWFDKAAAAREKSKERPKVLPR